MTNQRLWLTAVCAGVIAGWAAGCRDAQEPPTGYDQRLGDSAIGAPLPVATNDPGILSDPANYTPARPEAGLGGGPVDLPSRRRQSAGNRDAEVRAVVDRFLGALRGGDPGGALGTFRANDVAAVSPDDLDVVYTSLETLSSTFAQALADELGEAQAAVILGPLAKGADVAVSWEFAGPENASVTPNLALILFGPVRANPTMLVGKEGDVWQFQLDTPLTADEARQIVDYHKTLQAQLGQIINWLYEAQTIDPTVLTQFVTQALAGETIELPASTSMPAPDEPAAPAPGEAAEGAEAQP